MDKRTIGRCITCMCLWDFLGKDAKGLHYISHFLSHPGEKFSVHDLVTIVEGSPPPGSRQSQAKFETSGDLGDIGPILDDKANANYRRRRQDLLEELGRSRSYE